MFLHVSVILSTGGGVCLSLSACWDTDPPGADPPWSRPPLEQTPPGADPSRSRPPRPGTPPMGADTPPPGPGTPPQQTPPRADTLLPGQCMLGDTVNKRAVCILLECNLVLCVSFISVFTRDSTA